MSETLELASALIARRSVTPLDAGCQQLLADRLQPLGFDCDRLDYGDVSNLWARRGRAGPVFCFAGHTDVVPPGPEAQWRHPPFQPVVEDGLLYGRGAADMKGSVAAFVTALERYLADGHQPRGDIAMLITSDEEGPAVDGTRRVIETLSQRDERIDWCLVGEPSSTERVGDVVKVGRRGSLNGRLTVRGDQGHVAYPHLARNPVHLALAALDTLQATRWDEGNDHFPPTSFQISNINAGTGATNVIPGELEVLFNFRFSTEVTAEQLQQRVAAVLDDHNLDWAIDWSLSGEPFLTAEGDLVAATQAAVQRVCGEPPVLSTSGGTSDGRFIAPTGAQVLELGPVNANIHKVNEHVRAADLDRLSAIYEQMLRELLG